MVKNVLSESGQVFSLDFLIAAGLAVLAIGMLLNYYEVSVYQEKEAWQRDELSAIAVNAGNLALASGKCSLDTTGSPGFSAQGYALVGCADPGNWKSVSAQNLMLPSGFGCYVYWRPASDATAVHAFLANNACNADAPASVANVATVQRQFLGPAVPGTAITKAQYEKCIESGCTPGSAPYAAYFLVVKVWRGVQ